LRNVRVLFMIAGQVCALERTCVAISVRLLFIQTGPFDDSSSP
jgi:hypothetical protein